MQFVQIGFFYSINGGIHRAFDFILRRLSTRELTMTALFVTLITAGAFIRVPLPNCPFTLQILFTTLAGIILGSRLGAISVGIYIILGLIGVPVFTSGGGPGYVLQPTFGYLIGFMVGAYVVGRFSELSPTHSVKTLLIGAIINLLIVYGFGMIYLYMIMNVYFRDTYWLVGCYLVLFLDSCWA